MIAFPIVLGLTAIAACFLSASASSSARPYLHFSSALVGALAIAGFFDEALVGAIGLIVLALLPPVLGLAVSAGFARLSNSGVAAAFLAFACTGGIAAALNGTAAWSLVPLCAGVAVLARVGLRQLRQRPLAAIQIGISSLASGAAAAGLIGGRGRYEIALDLFAATALLAAALALARSSDRFVVEQGRRASRFAIGQAG